jgi:hypothetical protein
MPGRAHLRRIFWIAIASVISAAISHATAHPIDFSDWHATFGFQGERTSHAGVLINNRLYILGGLAYRPQTSRAQPWPCCSIPLAT